VAGDNKSHIILLDGKNLEEKDKKVLEMIGNNCPVAKSLHPDLEVSIQYNWL
jgi:uncharacterized OsmC-like protein